MKGFKGLLLVLMLAVLAVGCAKRQTLPVERVVERPVERIVEKVDVRRFMAFTPFYFRFDSDEIVPDNVERQSEYAFLDNNPDLDVLVIGFADPRGPRDYNAGLGLARAAAVRNILESKGIDPERIYTASQGEDMQTCAEKTKDCYQSNRRVVIQVR